MSPLPLCVASRLQDHVNDKKKLPILIFPEGKCDSVGVQTSFVFAFVLSKIQLSERCHFISGPDVSLATAALANDKQFYVGLDRTHTTMSP